MSSYSLTFSETSLAEEFEYNSDENDSDWDDCTFINPDQQEIIPINYNHNGSLCWQCDYCLEINHLKMSITEYNARCCKCEFTFFIESQTPTFYTDKWFIPKPIIPQQNHLFTNNHIKYKLNPQIVDKHTHLISGYCKKNFIKNIPKCLQQIITTFYKFHESLSYKNQTGMTMFINKYKSSAPVELFGDTHIHRPQSKQWFFRLDIEDNYDDNAYIEGIEFGVIRKGFKVEVGGNTTYYLLNTKDLRKGDIIKMELDLNERTLSYGINNQWFGVQHKNVHLSGTYQFYTKIKQKDVSLQLCQ